MALRVTQQYVDLLADGSGGKARVTQFYVEAIGQKGAAPQVTSTLALTDSATETVVPGGGIAESASSVLALTDTATENAVFSRAASNALALTDSATYLLQHFLSASSTLALTDEAKTGIFEHVADVLALTDSAVQNIKFGSAASALAFADIVNLVHTLSASNVLAFIDTAIQNIKFADASSVLAFSDSTRENIFNLDASSALSLVDFANVQRHLVASSALALTTNAKTNIHPVSASSVLAFTQSTTKVLIHNLFQEMFLDQDLDRDAIFDRHLASILNLTQSAEILIDREGVLCNYSPFVGSGPFVFPSTPPTLTPGTLTLFWPFVSPSLTVVLRNPEFGNKISFNANRVNRKSRGGKKLVYRKSAWPKFRALSLDISVLTTTQINDFKSFLNSTIGKEIGLTDHEGRTWKGVITTPETEITAIGGGSCGDYATSFIFEGAVQ